MGKLDKDFFNRDAVIVAEELLGTMLVREIDGRKVTAKVVETEAYMGVTDKAAHSYGGRRTPRVEVMYGQPGFSYVFIVYGMHHCFNVVTREEDNPQAVLIRAAEPVTGLEWMAQQRFKKPYHALTKTQRVALTNGPGKLCHALSIDRSLNGTDSCGDDIYFSNDAAADLTTVATRRVGIDYAQEAKDYLWRFYIKNNAYVSVK